MKRLLAIFLLAACATASAQTVKTLGYNTTNGQVVYSGTNTLTFTNNVAIGPDVVFTDAGELQWSGSARFSLETMEFFEPIYFDNTTNAATTRTNLGLPWTGLTNTNAADFQGALFSATNAAPTNTNAPTPDAWVDITVGTNVFKLPLWQ